MLHIATTGTIFMTFVTGSASAAAANNRSTQTTRAAWLRIKQRQSFGHLPFLELQRKSTAAELVKTGHPVKKIVNCCVLWPPEERGQQ